jgi:hypothetical protein
MPPKPAMNLWRFIGYLAAGQDHSRWVRMGASNQKNSTPPHERRALRCGNAIRPIAAIGLNYSLEASSLLKSPSKPPVREKATCAKMGETLLDSSGLGRVSQVSQLCLNTPSQEGPMTDAELAKVLGITEVAVAQLDPTRRAHYEQVRSDPG